MSKSLTLLPALLLAAIPATAGADPVVDVRTPFVLQGSVAYDCFGCGGTATFTGIITFLREEGVVTVPTTGELYVNETCTHQGSVSGMLHAGPDDYQVYIGRVASAAELVGTGPGGFYDAYAGAGTQTIDAPAGTCGVPLTATVTIAVAPIVNCYCQVARAAG